MGPVASVDPTQRFGSRRWATETEIDHDFLHKTKTGEPIGCHPGAGAGFFRCWCVVRCRTRTWWPDSDEHADQHTSPADQHAHEHTDQHAGPADQHAHKHADQHTGAADQHCDEHAHQYADQYTGATDQHCDKHAHEYAGASDVDEHADQHAGTTDCHQHRGTDQYGHEHLGASDVDECTHQHAHYRSHQYADVDGRAAHADG